MTPQVFTCIRRGRFQYNENRFGERKGKETPCKREIEGFYVVFTEDLLVFKSGAPNDCFL